MRSAVWGALRLAALMPALAIGALEADDWQASLDGHLTPSWRTALADRPKAAQPGSGLSLPAAWSADVVMHAESSGNGKGLGRFFYDAASRRSRLRVCFNITLFREEGDARCMDRLTKDDPSTEFGVNTTMGFDETASCQATPSPYLDFFGMLAGASRNGSCSLPSDELGELWAAVVDVGGLKVRAAACVAADGAPRWYNETAELAYKAGAAQIYEFSNVRLEQPPDEAFAPSDACARNWPPESCGDASVVELTMYRVHSLGEPASLENRDVGDALGDMAFFCQESSPGESESQVVTKWTVRANSSWIGYSPCLYRGGKNICFNGQRKNVGRQSAMGLGGGRAQGQCASNEAIGSWYSMHAEGACAEGAAIGEGGCTWTARPGRTVRAKCIYEERGLREMCAQERGHAPLVRSAAIFTAAVESEDPALGGCPGALAEPAAVAEGVLTPVVV